MLCCIAKFDLGGIQVGFIALGAKKAQASGSAGNRRFASQSLCMLEVYDDEALKHVGKGPLPSFEAQAPRGAQAAIVMRRRHCEQTSTQSRNEKIIGVIRIIMDHRLRGRNIITHEKAGHDRCLSP